MPTSLEARRAYENGQRRNQLTRADLADPKRWRFADRQAAPYPAL
ncbi:hypothetical protein ABZS88_23325 [Streptomyces sp. NPDC005480]